jgi:hypothetical protein
MMAFFLWVVSLISGNDGSFCLLRFLPPSWHSFTEQIGSVWVESVRGRRWPARDSLNEKMF